MKKKDCKGSGTKTQRGGGILSCVGVLLCLGLLLGGCKGAGSSEELSAFREKMVSFFSKVEAIDEGINALNAASEQAPENMLSLMEQLRDEFESLSDVEVPDDFAALEGLPQEAADNLTKAIELYREGMNPAAFDQGRIDAALQYYERANLRLQYIISILHGQLPEGDNITYEYESEEASEE